VDGCCADRATDQVAAGGLRTDSEAAPQAVAGAGFSSVEQRKYDLPVEASDNLIFKVTSSM
jgi:hypothetical protein